MSNSLKDTSSKMVQLITFQQHPKQWTRFPVTSGIKDLWPQYSYNLTHLDVYLLGYFKECVFQNKPHTTDTIKGKIINAIKQSDSMTVRCTTNNIRCHIRMHLVEDSDHFWHMKRCQFLPHETRYVSYQSYHAMKCINIAFCSQVHDLQLSVRVSLHYE